MLCKNMSALFDARHPFWRLYDAYPVSTLLNHPNEALMKTTLCKTVAPQVLGLLLWYTLYHDDEFTELRTTIGDNGHPFPWIKAVRDNDQHFIVSCWTINRAVAASRIKCSRVCIYACFWQGRIALCICDIYIIKVQLFTYSTVKAALTLTVPWVYAS